jgi:hypothetical protein
MARRWRWLLLIVGGILFLVWGCDRLLTIYWVGSTELEIEFSITEASTETPVSAARVEVQSGGGFYEERETQEFVLVANSVGEARKVCRNCMCFGAQSGLRFTETFAVRLPWWRFRVIAKDYEPSAWTDLDAMEFRRLVQRLGPDKAKLIVRMSLFKGHGEAKASADLPHD